MITKELKVKKYKFRPIGIVATFVVVVFGIYYFINFTVNASTTGWMAGRIIDDSVFTANNSMSATQIQSFLNGKVPSCDTNGTQPASDFGRPDLTHAQYAALRGWQKPPYICLKNYSNSGKSAAQLIYDTAQKYRISPKVLIVLLQKEQSLVTDTWPLNIPQYRSATGYGCPDTAACDSTYYGLPNQLDWAGKMYRAILDDSPTWYTPYELGNNYIRYNPSTSCGGSNVYIQNRATQALYNYTPYQPNSATLSAAWGATVTCGAYGNLNFYRYYTKWFGATTSVATYGYSVVSKEFYSDYTYNTKISSTPTIEPNQTVYLKLTIKNTGNQTWYSDNLRIGTQNPENRASPFYVAAGNGNWINAGRPATMSGTNSINGGETATFQFAMKAPPHLGSYAESFGILIEGYRWVGGAFSIPINVASASLYYIKKLSFSAYSDSQMTRKLDPSKISLYTNSKIYAKTTIKNTGNQTLPANLTKIGTSNPENRASPYSDGSWLSSGRAAVADEGSIAPQSIGNFVFTMTAPNIPIARTTEQFGLLIENKMWLSDNIGSFSIQTTIRPPIDLTNGQSLKIGGKLLSSNDNYVLVLQGDGNLVLYSYGKALWSSRTAGKSGIRLVMQGDGNLVLYTQNGKPVWNSRTDGKGVSQLFMQGDGNLVLYNNQGYTWASWTVGK